MDFDDFNTPVTLFGWLCNDLKISGCRIPRLSALLPSDLKVPMSDNKKHDYHAHKVAVAKDCVLNEENSAHLTDQTPKSGDASITCT